MSAPYLGDFTTSQLIQCEQTFVDSTGLPTALTSGSACVKKLGTATLAFGGVGAVTTSGGLAFVTITPSGAASYFTAMEDYLVYVGYGSVGAITAVGYPFGRFSLSNRSTTLATLSANVTQWLTSVPNPLISGRPDVNAAAVTVSGDLLKWLGSTPNVLIGGRPDVNAAAVTVSGDLLKWLGSTPNVLLSGRVDANAAAVTVTAAVLTMANGSIQSATFSAGAIDAAAIAANAIASSELAQTAADKIADSILLRDLATGASATTRNVANALKAIRNKNAITGINNPYTLTVYEADDATPAYTAQLTFSANTFGVSTAV